MVSVSLDPRAARARHPDAVAFDSGVEITAVTVLLQESVQFSEQGHPPSLTYSPVPLTSGPLLFARRTRGAR